jgi:hypothetical protein
MDPQEDNSKGSVKLKIISRQYTPKTNLKQPTKEFIPSDYVAYQEGQVEQDVEPQTQSYDYDQVYLQWVNYYLNLGCNQQQSEYNASVVMQQQQMNQNQENDGSYQNEQYPDDQAYPNQQNEGEEQKEYEEEGDYQFGDKTKKPYGQRRKDKYQGKHHDDYEESDEGYYDELGFYYMSDGSFYDPDGFYFDQTGYDKLGGYYDDSANYHHADGNITYYGGKSYYKSKNNYHNQAYVGEGEDPFNDVEEEPEEDKYTKAYIEYILDSKYYEDLEYLKNTKNGWAYLRVGNLAEGTRKQDLLKYFGNEGIETSQITIMMSGGIKMPVGKCEIYKIPTAIQVLKCCGNELNEKQMIIEVDEHNEKRYGGNLTEHVHENEYYEEEDSRYTKFDSHLDDKLVEGVDTEINESAGAL